MREAKFLRAIECLKKKPGIVILLLPCLLIVTLYYISGKYSPLENYFPEKFYNPEYGEFNLHLKNTIIIRAKLPFVWIIL